MSTSTPNLPLPQLSGLQQLPARQKLGLLVGLAAAAALAVGAWLWSQTPEWRVLFSNVPDRDGGAIVAALAQMNVPYKVSESGGAILVPANAVHEARLKLASQGLPRGGTVGFELMDSQRLGLTQFQEQVNYQRALEGELAKSIQSLGALRGARVHLAIPKPSVFMRERDKPTASVLVSLAAGRTLDRAQLAGIVHLVASSVPELSAKAVSVVDQDGKLLTSPDAPGGAAALLDPGQLAYVQNIEQATIRRILDIVEPIAGRDNVRAQVTADIDFSESQSTAESFKPNGNPAEAAVRSQQSSEAGSPAGGIAQGVPGALSNQPPSGGTADGKGGAATPPAAQAAINGRKDATINYELDKTVRHTRSAGGAIRRLSAAVVVNHRQSTDAEGKTASAPLSAEELAQITALVKEAMGFSDKRGDTVNVANAAFSRAAAADALPEVPWWKEPETLAMGRELAKALAAVAAVLFLVLGVIRPLLRSLAQQPQPAPAWAVADALPGPETGEGAPALPRGNSYDQRLADARTLARKDPKIVANVVKNWVSKDG